MKFRDSLIRLFTVCVLGLSLLPSPLVSAQANVSNNLIENDVEEEFDLSYTPETLVYDDGEVIGKIIVTEVDTPDIIPYGSIYHHSEPWKNKSYNIHYIGGNLNLGFGITISNGKIVNAYDAWHNGFFYAIESGDLTFNSSQATLPAKISLFWRGFPAGTSSRLKATISGKNLVTTYDIP